LHGEQQKAARQADQKRQQKQPNRHSGGSAQKNSTMPGTWSGHLGSMWAGAGARVLRLPLRGAGVSHERKGSGHLVDEDAPLASEDGQSRTKSEISIGSRPEHCCAPGHGPGCPGSSSAADPKPQLETYMLAQHGPLYKRASVSRASQAHLGIGMCRA
jgi:hypothetical protein